MPVQLVERGWNEAIRNLGPTEYNTYPAERYALPNPGREEVLAMASRTQAQQDAYIKNALETGISRAFEGEFTKGITNNGPSADRQRRLAMSTSRPSRFASSSVVRSCCSLFAAASL